MSDEAQEALERLREEFGGTPMPTLVCLARMRQDITRDMLIVVLDAMKAKT